MSLRTFTRIVMPKIGYVHSVAHHPQHKNLEIVTVLGVAGQFAALEGTLRPEQQVIIFTDGELLPKRLQDALGITGILKGAVRTYRVRGQVSHGVVAPMAALEEKHYPDLSSVGEQDLGEYLGILRGGSTYPRWITRWLEKSVKSEVGEHDIQDVRFNMSVASDLLLTPVIVTEKIDGVHWTLRINENFEYVVGTRGSEFPDKEMEYNPFYRVLLDNSMLYSMIEIRRQLNDAGAGVHNLVFRGEMWGNDVRPYQHGWMPTPRVALFDIELDGQSVGARHANWIFNAYALPQVPVLSQPNQTLREWLEGRNVLDAANGKSRLFDFQREGVVVQPEKETNHAAIGRTILKFPSVDYITLYHE